VYSAAQLSQSELRQRDARTNERMREANEWIAPQGERDGGSHVPRRIELATQELLAPTTVYITPDDANVPGGTIQ